MKEHSIKSLSIASPSRNAQLCSQLVVAASSRREQGLANNHMRPRSAALSKPPTPRACFWPPGVDSAPHSTQAARPRPFQAAPCSFDAVIWSTKGRGINVYSIILYYFWCLVAMFQTRKRKGLSVPTRTSRI